MTLFEALVAALDDKTGRPDPRAMRALFAEIQAMARAVAGRHTQHVDVSANWTLLKLWNWRSRHLRELGDAPNREVRLRWWCRTVLRNKFIDLLRKDAQFEKRKAALREEQEAQPADAHPGEPETPADDDPIVRSALEALDALTDRALAGAQPRYRSGLAQDCADLRAIARGESSIEAILTREGADPDDRTAYDRVHKRLWRVRERLAAQIERDYAEERIDDPTRELLERLVERYLRLRPRRASP